MEVAFLNFPILSTTVFSLVLFFVWAGLKYHNITVNFEPELESSIAIAIYGATSALVMFFQIRLLQTLIRRRIRDRNKEIKVPQQEEPSYAFMSQSKLKKYYQENESHEEEPILTNDPQENEQILNEILEKIHKNGSDSITLTEKRFLEEYSKHIR